MLAHPLTVTIAAIAFWATVWRLVDPAFRPSIRAIAGAFIGV